MIFGCRHALEQLAGRLQTRSRSTVGVRRFRERRRSQARRELKNYSEVVVSREGIEPSTRRLRAASSDRNSWIYGRF